MHGNVPNYSGNELKEILYNLEVKQKWCENRLQNNKNITPKNKELFLKFINHCQANGLSKNRILIYYRILSTLGMTTNKTFDKNMAKEDIEEVLNEINSRKISDWTKEMTKSGLKRYFRWLYELESNEKLPRVVSWIKSTTIPCKINKEDLITEEDVGKMIDATTNPMKKAMFSVLFEAALRPGELLSMKIKDCSFEESYAKIRVRGKMEKKQGDRDVFLVKSYQLLLNWINSHPLKDNPERMLWITTQNRSWTKRDKEGNIIVSKKLYGQPITIQELNKDIRRYAKKAGLTKRVFPYLFRHSRGTELYKTVGEAIAKKFMGHSKSTRMANVYNHLNDDDVLEAIKKQNGIETKKEQETNGKCPKCNKHNPYGAKLCCYCGMALDITQAVEMKVKQEEQKERNEMLELLYQIAKSDKAFMEKFRNSSFRNDQAERLSKI